MANDITGSCEIGASVELIPDAVDDILPAGYLNEGTLPLDTTEQDIGVDPAGGMSITGECTECPPGTTWGCCADEPEYPEGTPIPISCRYDYSEFVPTLSKKLSTGGYGLMAAASSSSQRYVFLKPDDSSTSENIILDAGEDHGDCADFAELDGWIYTMAATGASASTQHLMKINISTKEVVKVLLSDITTLTAWYDCSSVNTMPGYVAYTFNHVFNPASSTYGATVILTSNFEHVSVIYGTAYYPTYSSEFINGQIWISNFQDTVPSNPGINVYNLNGTLDKVIPNHISGTYPSRYFAARIVDLGSDVGSGIVVAQNGYYYNTGAFSSLLPGGYSGDDRGVCSLTFMDYNGIELATIVSPDGQVDADCFGGSISRYGNFICVSENNTDHEGITKTGQIHMYDLNFNHVRTLTAWGDAPQAANRRYGTVVEFNQTHIAKYEYYGLSNNAIICEYQSLTT